MSFFASFFQRAARGVRLRLESFEERAQPSAVCTSHTAATSHVQLNMVSHPMASFGPSSGLSPAQIKQAYGLNQLADDGSGQTIAVVVAYDDPNIGSDLATFDSAYGLPAPASFNKAVNPGTATDGGWSGETALDVEWAHALAPKASILLVEAKSDSTADLMAAVDYARKAAGVSVVSMSWGGSESTALEKYDSYFTTPSGHTPVTFVAAAGDSGAGAEWPASSPNVLAVGGTSIYVGSGGTYETETAWSGSGGGFSQVYAVPTYQNGVVTGHRAVPDVAFDANPNTGLAVYSSVPDGGRTGWEVVGGTSAGSPAWAAIIALTNQERAAHGEAAIGRAQDTIYSLQSSAFHDITSGGNGYATRVGYDLVTGRGSPVANVLIPELAGLTPPTTTTPPTTNPTPPTTGTGVTSGTGGTTTTTGGTTTGTGTGTHTGGTTGVSVPIWYIPGYGWGFGGMFGWNYGGYGFGGFSTPVWFMF